MCEIHKWRYGALLLAALLMQATCGRDSRSPDAEFFVLEARHMHFANFSDEHRVSLGEDFSIGDTEVIARIVRFEPDLAINTDTKEIFSRTQEMNNPAVLVEVNEPGKEAVQVWAFRNPVPHMRGKTPLMFLLRAIEDPKGNRLDTPADSSAGGQEPTHA